jgi:hypothetical protein
MRDDFRLRILVRMRQDKVTNETLIEISKDADLGKEKYFRRSFWKRSVTVHDRTRT